MGAGIGLEDAVAALLSEYPDVLYGFADISYSEYADKYRSALVFAVPYGKQLTTDTYREADFEEGIQTARRRLEAIVARLEDLLRAHGTAYWVPPVAQRDETELLAPFSFKYAATRAGIGWIGKNDVVITRRQGPRVRLSAVLIDSPFEYGTPVTESLCPEGCRACVDACPCRALKDVTWNADRRREEIVDYRRCNRMRSAAIPRLGRKDACGKCLAACPFGTDSRR